MIDPETLVLHLKDELNEAGKLETKSEILGHEKSNISSICDGRKSIYEEKMLFKFKMEQDILNLHEEIDKEKYENPVIDLCKYKKMKVRQLVEKYETVTQRKYFEVSKYLHTLKSVPTESLHFSCNVSLFWQTSRPLGWPMLCGIPIHC